MALPHALRRNSAQVTQFYSLCGPKFRSMKITQALRRDVLEMGDAAAADLAAKAAGLSEAERRAGMAAKSAAFEAGRGKLYV